MLFSHHVLLAAFCVFNSTENVLNRNFKCFDLNMEFILLVRNDF